jgi:hypothetical protein
MLKILPEEMKTLVEVLNDLRKQGFKCDFLLKDGTLKCKDTNEKFSADDLLIENHTGLKETQIPMTCQFFMRFPHQMVLKE